MPFTLLTNGGGILEKERAHKINTALADDSSPIDASNLILCHTPLSDPKFVDKYRDSFVVVSGLGNVLDVALHYGYKKAIDILELYALFPNACPGIKDIDPIPLRN